MTGAWSGPASSHDGHRVLLPAFGRYTGGLDVFDPAIRDLLAPEFEVVLLGAVHPLPRTRLIDTLRPAR